MKWILPLLLISLTVYAADRRVKRVATVTPAECLIGAGDNLDLCLIRHTSEGLLLEFGRPAYQAYFDLIGPGARIEIWLRREDIGDLSRAQIYEPRRPLGEGEIWGIGVGTDPPFVAVRLRGRIGTIEDVGYDR